MYKIDATTLIGTTDEIQNVEAECILPFKYGGQEEITDANDLYGNSKSIPAKLGTTTSFPQPPLVPSVNLMDIKFCSFQDRSHCSNCYKELSPYDDVCNRPGMKFGDILCSRKSSFRKGPEYLSVTVLEALDIIFELNKKSYISEVILDDMEYSICWKCSSILTKLFKLYVEFTDCTESPSYIKAIICHNKALTTQNCALENGFADEAAQCGTVDSCYSDCEDPQLNFEVNFQEEEDSYVPPSQGSALRKRKGSHEALGLQESDAQHSGEDIYVEPAPVKRGRGRPRKNVTAQFRNVPKNTSETLTTTKEDLKRPKTDRRSEKDRVLPYKCNECSALFSRPSRLERHSAVHCGRRYVCSKCNAGFKFSIYLDRHRATQHPRTRDDQKDIGSPRKIKTGKIKVTTARGKLSGGDLRRAHVCRDCGLVFTTPSGLLRHSQLHDNSAYACDEPDCNEEFASRRLLIRHKVDTHNMGPSELQDLQMRPLLLTRLKRKLRNKHVIDAEFPTSQTEQKRTGRFKCTQCCESFSRSDHIIRHLSVHTENTYVCDLCDGGFATIKQLEEHINTAHTPKEKQKRNHWRTRKAAEKIRIPRNCPEEGCTYTFTRTNHLRQHLLSKHNGKVLPPDEAQTCPVCNLVLKSKARLDNHLQRHRPLIRENSYQCDICGKKYRDANILRNHKGCHGLSKPYICEKCGYASRTSYQLTRHNEMVHVGTRSHHCKECGQSFKKKQHLIDHTMTHKTMEYRPYSCTVEGCTKAYRSKRNLRQHLEAHTNSKFQCETCGRVFTRKDNLKVHVDTVHLGKPGRTQKEKEKVKAEGGSSPPKKVRKRKQTSVKTGDQIIDIGNEDVKSTNEEGQAGQTHQVVIVEEASIHHLQQHQQFHLLTDARIIQQGTLNSGQNIVIPNPFGEFFYTL